MADDLLEHIAETVDTVEGIEDASLNQGVLEIHCDNGSQIVVNRHAPTQEIWVAARSGGYHFRRTAGRWSDTRSGETLSAALTRVLAEQTGATVRFCV